MAWDLKGDSPIYLQLIELIKKRILSGEYPAGDRLPPVRELAALASVNPNTMQKALNELERTGLLFCQRTSGRFITQDQSMIQNLRKDMAKNHARIFLNQMIDIGYTPPETIELLGDISRRDCE